MLTGTTWFGVNVTTRKFAFLTNFRQLNGVHRSLPGSTLLAGNPSEMSLASWLLRLYLTRVIKRSFPDDYQKPPSRGTLVLDFLSDKYDDYDKFLVSNYKRYAGFNLVYGGIDKDEKGYAKILSHSAVDCESAPQ